MTNDPTIALEASLNLETATIPWRELQRFFAAGRAIGVSPKLDLIKVGAELSRDNAEQFKQWMEDGKVDVVGDEQAQAWHEADAEVWALVIRPYVLVQGKLDS
ncbi:DUF2288 domain-containing protein [Marinimicrobium agarilyticum]|uniref:DUF2288 domain-containing protein n=1 Tax=Marinimicrobium agarilyticum TaxID=306546 RepID=UPI0004265B90|nr:DUF2288 domain-containing protein [Marinimicrobium agarilyticum]